MPLINSYLFEVSNDCRYKIEQGTRIGREKEKKVEEVVERPATVNIYAEDKDIDTKLLQGKARDEQSLQKFKQKN